MLEKTKILLRENKKSRMLRDRHQRGARLEWDWKESGFGGMQQELVTLQRQWTKKGKEDL